MCGIIGYVGYKRARNMLLEGLKRLEYRGYDSAGLAVAGEEVRVYKKKGEVDELSKKAPKMSGKCGIAHTRWATHGKPSDENAHPFFSCDRKIALVHNGIIENYKSVKKELEDSGHKFTSTTDSEVLVHLVEENYRGNLKSAVSKALGKVKGSYAIAAIRVGKDEIISARKEAPLVIGVGERENFVASDVPAFLKYATRAIYLDDGELGVVTAKKVRVSDLEGKEIKKEIKKIPWNLEEVEKSGYPHFMLKEIHEQLRAIREVLRGRVSEIEPYATLPSVPDGLLTNVGSIKLIGCGTSYHAALVGKSLIEELAGISASADFSSEFRYSKLVLNENSLVIAITQSGETADTLAALRRAKHLGYNTIAIANVLGSSISRIADHTIYLRAGPEICVAATKTFLSQVIVLTLLALKLGALSGSVKPEVRKKIITSLKMMPRVVEKILSIKKSIQLEARKLAHKKSIFFIGRGIDHATAMEGALKMKEISYLHAEAQPAGELKHGHFALLTQDTPVVAIALGSETYDTMLSTIGEVKARNARVIAVGKEGDKDLEKYADTVLPTPPIPYILSPIPIAVMFQLLAYYTAKERGCSIDKPRNLAKSVTVE